MHTYMHAYEHTYIHTYIHTHIHAHIHTFEFSRLAHLPRLATQSASKPTCSITHVAPCSKNSPLSQIFSQRDARRLRGRFHSQCNGLTPCDIFILQRDVYRRWRLSRSPRADFRVQHCMVFTGVACRRASASSKPALQLKHSDPTKQ